MKIFTENTKVSLSLVLLLLGGAFSTGMFYFKTEASAESISRLESKQDAYDEDIQDVKFDLRLIKEKLGIRNGSRHSK